MTYPEFTNIIEGIGRKINWDMKLAMVNVEIEGRKELFEDSDFPLSSTKSKEENRVFRMSDAEALMGLAKQQGS